MFTVTHFRTEFIQQSQATILRKVTMTQFMLVMVCLAVGLGLFDAPFGLAPLFIVAGYVAGYVHQGEILLRRLISYAVVWTRSMVQRPRLVNIHAEWEQVRVRAEQQQVKGSFAATVVLDEP